jgi:hypothetical protein
MKEVCFALTGMEKVGFGLMEEVSFGPLVQAANIKADLVKHDPTFASFGFGKVTEDKENK